MRQDFDIRETGAVPDGQTLNTRAIQRAIDACARAGGGRVLCGPGTWLTGSLQIKSGVEVHLLPGCRIAGSPRLEDYPSIKAEGFHPEKAPEKSACALFYAAGAENIALTGPGTIDGGGLAFYNTAGNPAKLSKPDTPRPRIGMFYRCRNLRITDVTFLDCACWTLWLMQSEQVRVRGAVIRSNRRMRNVDGIDVDACRNVSISDCLMDTEDDCIAVRAIQALYDAPAVCENLVVANCVLKSACQGVRIGCPSDGVIRNCTFSNLVIEAESNGILFDFPPFYLDPDLGACADIADIAFSNAVIRSRRAGIRIAVQDGIALKRLARLHFAGLRVRCGEPCVVQGSPETTIQDVRFADAAIESSAGDALLCRHCRRIHFDAVELAAGMPGENSEPHQP